MSGFTAIDLDKLPAPKVIEEISYEVILAEMIADLVARQPEMAEVLERESEPSRKILETAAFRETLMRQRINESSKATMLAYAKGSDLDHEVARFGVERLLITPADPDAIPPIEAVYEDDDSLRLRGQLALEGFSTAGPKGAYEFHSLSASALVKSVQIDAPAFDLVEQTPEMIAALPEGAIVLMANHDAGLTDPMPGDVAVTVLSTEGDGSADQPLLDAVSSALDEETVRPFTDRPRVRSATIVTYAVDASLIMFPGPDSAVVLQAAIDALTQYVENSRAMGAAPTLSGFYAALKQPGVYDVILNEPPEAPSVSDYASAYCTSINVVIGGTHE